MSGAFWAHRAGGPGLQPACVPVSTLSMAPSWLLNWSFSSGTPSTQSGISIAGCVLTSRVRVCRTLYKLLKCTCLHCFKLKMLDAEVSA